MAKHSIPGTVEVLTYQTGKADAVDGNRNDITTVCHEAPPGMFRTAKNPNADSSQEAMFKEKLTSQQVHCKSILPGRSNWSSFSPRDQVRVYWCLDGCYQRPTVRS